MFKAIAELISRNILAITVCSCGAIVMLLAANAKAANCSISTSPTSQSALLAAFRANLRQHTTGISGVVRPVNVTQRPRPPSRSP